MINKNSQIAFCAGEVLGHPNRTEFMKRVREILKAQPDMLELSIPFSDPVADGPTIQYAHEQALQSGVNPVVALELVAKIRALTKTPIFLIVYSNLIFHCGVGKFYQELKRVGVSSILIPDVSLEEIMPFAQAAKKNHVQQILIVSENTTLERLKKIQKVATGFLYVVSTLGVTGVRKNLNTHINGFIQKLKKNTSLPLMIGFGISSSEHIKTLKKAKPDAVVVCSAIVKTPTAQLAEFITTLKNAC